MACSYIRHLTACRLWRL